MVVELSTVFLFCWLIFTWVCLGSKADPYHLTPSGGLLSKSQKTNGRWRGWNPHARWQDCKMARPLWKTVWQFFKKLTIGGTWGSQSVKRPTLAFCLGHDLGVVGGAMGLSPALGSMLGGESIEILLLSAPLPAHSLSRSLSLK